ncbi:hypothetical protein CR513_01113, partial [Mucuna pruriens]
MYAQYLLGLVGGMHGSVHVVKFVISIKTIIKLVSNACISRAASQHSLVSEKSKQATYTLSLSRTHSVPKPKFTSFLFVPRCFKECPIDRVGARLVSG